MRARIGGCVSGALLLAFALSAPGAAAQETPNLSEDCREQAPSNPERMCRGLEKLSERGSAECRRATEAADRDDEEVVPDERCYGPMGKRVNDAAVTDYASSWTHRALQDQYELGGDLPFRDAPWIGTHNSYNSTSENPTLSHTDSNQQLSLGQQLAIDVRKLEIDVHWFRSAHAGGQPAAVVCHARGADQQHAGCSTERLLSDVLQDVAAWLNANRGQVVLVQLEDHLGTPEAYASAVDALQTTLTRPQEEGGGSLIYGTGAPRGGCRDLPLELTRNNVLAAGAQVVLASGCGEWGDLVFNWDSVHRETRPRGFRPINSNPPTEACGPDFTRTEYDSLLIRYFEDSTWLSTSGLDGAEPDDGITPQTAAEMARCGVDLVDLDQILPDDGRLESLVWSWKPGEPDTAGGHCAAQLDDTRWALRDCGERRPAACRLPGGGWTLTNAANFVKASGRCAQRGGRFDLPRTGYDNWRLAEVAPAQGAWIARGGPPAETP